MEKKETQNCKNCLHNGVCYMQETCSDIDKQITEFGCADFADTAKYLCLPCKVGDNVYRIVFSVSLFDGAKWAVDESKTESTKEIVAYLESGKIGEDIFFTREDAEKEKERRNKEREKKSEN